MLSPVNHILSLCAQKGVSSDILHEELRENVALAIHAAWKPCARCTKLFVDSVELLLDNSFANQLVDDCQSWDVSQS